MKLKYVSKNTQELYKSLLAIRDQSQRSSIEGSTPLVKFTKKHRDQINAIERMEIYLSPRKIKPSNNVDAYSHM